LNSTPLTIIADGHIWGVRSAFAEFSGHAVDLRVVEAREISPSLVQGADILLTRSSTKVNAALLAGSSVRFAATATVGDDHYDKHWLAGNGIAFASAAGSSTGSVIEYMLAALLHLHAAGRLHLANATIGIVGVGRIGSALAELLGRLGVRTLLCDPPRARREGSAGFVDLAAILAEADLITLHTPLERGGEDATFHLLDSARLSQFQGKGILNAARGAVIDNRALLTWLNGDPHRYAALDCWEGEPEIGRVLLAHPCMALATAHIAGHSLDGKAANTQAVYDALCAWLGVAPTWRMEQELPPTAPLTVTLPETNDPWLALHALVAQLYAIAADDTALRALLAEPTLAPGFARLRRFYPPRRAFGQHLLTLGGGNRAAHALIERAGLFRAL